MFWRKKDLLELNIGQGSRGKWRFTVYKDGKCLAVCQPQGYGSRNEALEAAQYLLENKFNWVRVSQEDLDRRPSGG